MHRLIPLIVMLAGCEGWLDTDEYPTWPGDTADTSDTSDTGDTGDTGTTNCPAGLAEASDIQVSLRAITISGATYLGTFEPGLSYDGQAGACVSSDGTQVEVLIHRAGVPFAWVSSRPESLDRTTIMRDPGAYLDAFGFDPPTTWSGDDWFQGEWFVLADGASTNHSINAYANNGANSLWLDISISVTP